LSMNWMAVVSEVINRLPIEKLVSRPPDNRKHLEELQDILSGAEAQKAAPQKKTHLEPDRSNVSTEETIAYQNREIVKRMRALAIHCVQRFRIAGKPCDCGQGRHLLEIEELAEEAVQMVDNPDIYYRIIETGKELEPKVTPEVIASGRHDDEYPKYARIYRDYCKELGLGEGQLLRHSLETEEEPVTPDEDTT